MARRFVIPSALDDDDCSHAPGLPVDVVLDDVLVSRSDASASTLAEKSARKYITNDSKCWVLIVVCLYVCMFVE